MEPIGEGAPWFENRRQVRRHLQLQRMALGDVVGRTVNLGQPRRPPDLPPWHFGVVVAPDEIVSLGLRGVVVERVEVFVLGGRAYLFRRAADPVRSMDRARSRVGVVGLYDVKRFNCAHFASWCLEAFGG